MAFLKDVESEELRELVKSCFKEINSLKEQLSEENKDIKTNEVVKNVLIQNENQNTNLTARINELTEEVNQKETALKEKELLLQEKDTKIKEKDLEISELTTKLNAPQATDDDSTEILKKQITELESTIESQKKEIDLLSTTSEESSSQNEKELKLEISRLKERNEELKSTSSNTEINQLRSVIDRQTEELKEIPVLKNQLTIEVTGRDQKIKKYEEEIDSLKNQLESSTKPESEIIESKELEISELNDKVSQLEKTIDELKSSDDESLSEDYSKQIEELNEKISSLESENKNLKESSGAQIVPASDNMNSLIEEFTQKSNELIEVQSELQRVQDLNKINEFKLVELENENAKLKSSIDEIPDNTTSSDDSELTEEIDSLKEKLSQKDAEISDKDTQISDLKARLESTLDSDDEQLNKVKHDLINKTQEYDALELDLLEKDATIESFKQQYEKKMKNSNF